MNRVTFLITLFMTILTTQGRILGPDVYETQTNGLNTDTKEHPTFPKASLGEEFFPPVETPSDNKIPDEEGDPQTSAGDDPNGESQVTSEASKAKDNAIEQNASVAVDTTAGNTVADNHSASDHGTSGGRQETDRSDGEGAEERPVKRVGVISQETVLDTIEPPAPASSQKADGVHTSIENDDRLHEEDSMADIDGEIKREDTTTIDIKREDHVNEREISPDEKDVENDPTDEVSNRTDMDPEQRFPNTTDVNNPGLQANKIDVVAEVTNETATRSIQEMLEKLNVMIENHKHCSHATDSIGKPSTTTKRSDVQGDFDAEEENETKRTITEIIQKLNGIMFYGSRCPKSGNGSVENETSLLIETTGDRGILNENVNNETQERIGEHGKGKRQLNLIDIDFDWSVFEHYPLKPKRKVIDLDCFDQQGEEKEDKDSTGSKDDHLDKDSRHQHCDDDHHNTPIVDITTTSAQIGNKDGDPSCQRKTGTARARKPCFDITRQESVLSQLCGRLTSLEDDVIKASSHVNTHHTESQEKAKDETSYLRSEVTDLKEELRIIKRTSAFSASAVLDLDGVHDYKVQINQQGQFDPSTGVFTVPYSGMYHIFVNQFYTVESERVTLQVKVGGSSNQVVVSGSGRSSQSLTALVHLEPGQTVWLEGVIGHDPQNNDIIFKRHVTFGAMKLI